MELKRLTDDDFESIHSVINDGAKSYIGFIPPECLHSPYMSKSELSGEIEDGVEFWGIELNGVLPAVMGFQCKGDVSLIRHAYTLQKHQRQGFGSKLLTHILSLSDSPILIGTWGKAFWAVQFYERNGFKLHTTVDSENLRRKYWAISETQIKNSVVLSNAFYTNE